MLLVHLFMWCKGNVNDTGRVAVLGRVGRIRAAHRLVMTVFIVAMNLRSQFPRQQAWHGNVI